MEIIADKAAMSIQKFSPVKVFDWEEERDGRTIQNREFDFLVRISGNVNSPQIERDKFIDVRWVDKKSLDLLLENRVVRDTVIYDLVKICLDRVDSR